MSLQLISELFLGNHAGGLVLLIFCFHFILSLHCFSFFHYISPFITVLLPHLSCLPHFLSLPLLPSLLCPLFFISPSFLFLHLAPSSLAEAQLASLDTKTSPVVMAASCSPHESDAHLFLDASHSRQSPMG